MLRKDDIQFFTVTFKDSDDKPRLVPVESVESQQYFQSLGRTEHGHAELLSEKEYQMSKDVLIGNK